MMRTHYCGDLRPEHIGRTVTVCGWVSARREHGERLAFVDLRDRAGVVQCVVDGDRVDDVRNEWVLQITGTVRHRPEGTTNPELPTGEVELGDCTVDVLNTAEPPPFPVTDRVETSEDVRLEHRYLDIRRPRLQRNLRLRAKVNSTIRTSMEAQGFAEVETPLLMASTPEGARDFVVPSRLSPGEFYALPQSPQLFKQLLMVGGWDRYYQIARCLRDEDLRADRQFEFTQLDAEMSFATQEDVIAAISVCVSDVVEVVSGERPGEIARMTWHEADERYGSDKPDTRFGMELVELTDLFGDTGFNAFKSAEAIKGILVPDQGAMTRAQLDKLTDRAKAAGAAGLVWMRVEEAEGVNSPVAKFLSPEEIKGLRERLGADIGDLLLLEAGDRRLVNKVLGVLRLELGRPPINAGGLNLLWVVDFPLFESIDDDGRPVPAHHPFTMPHAGDIDRLESDPLSVRSQAYDLVLNGWELGSGSVRIHRADIQQRVFSLLGIDPDAARRKFGFLLDAFRFGAPPHAGFAFGIDRLVAILAGEENIREVIAFPKTQSGTDPLTGAPGPIDDRQLKELGLRTLPPPSKG